MLQGENFIGGTTAKEGIIVGRLLRVRRRGCHQYHEYQQRSVRWLEKRRREDCGETSHALIRILMSKIICDCDHTTASLAGVMFVTHGCSIFYRPVEATLRRR